MSKQNNKCCLNYKGQKSSTSVQESSRKLINLARTQVQQKQIGISEVTGIGLKQPGIFCNRFSEVANECEQNLTQLNSLREIDRGAVTPNLSAQFDNLLHIRNPTKPKLVKCLCGNDLLEVNDFSQKKSSNYCPSCYLNVFHKNLTSDSCDSEQIAPIVKPELQDICVQESVKFKTEIEIAHSDFTITADVVNDHDGKCSVLSQIEEYSLAKIKEEINNDVVITQEPLIKSEYGHEYSSYSDKQFEHRLSGECVSKVGVYSKNEIDLQIRRSAGSSRDSNSYKSTSMVSNYLQKPLDSHVKRLECIQSNRRLSPTSNRYSNRSYDNSKSKPISDNGNISIRTLRSRNKIIVPDEINSLASNKKTYSKLITPNFKKSEATFSGPLIIPQQKIPTIPTALVSTISKQNETAASTTTGSIINKQNESNVPNNLESTMMQPNVPSMIISFSKFFSEFKKDILDLNHKSNVDEKTSNDNAKTLLDRKKTPCNNIDNKTSCEIYDISSDSIQILTLNPDNPSVETIATSVAPVEENSTVDMTVVSTENELPICKRTINRPWKKVVSFDSEDSPSSSNSEFAYSVPELEFSNSEEDHDYTPEHKRKSLSDEVNSVKSKTSRESFSKVKNMFHEQIKPSNPARLVISQQEIPHISKSTTPRLNKSIVPASSTPSISKENESRVPILKEFLKSANSQSPKKVSTLRRKVLRTRFFCPVCPTYSGFRSGSNYKRHLWKHGKEKSFICVLCDKTFDTAGAMSAHGLLVHVNSDANNQGSSLKKQPTLCKCRGCYVVTKSISELESHTCFNTFKEYKCPVCARIYFWKWELDHHFQNQHSKKNNTSSKNNIVSPTTSDLRILDHNLTTPHNRQSTEHRSDQKLKTVEILISKQNETTASATPGPRISRENKPNNLESTIIQHSVPPKIICFSNFFSKFKNEIRQLNHKDKDDEKTSYDKAKTLLDRNKTPYNNISNNKNVCETCEISSDSILILSTNPNNDSDETMVKSTVPVENKSTVDVSMASTENEIPICKRIRNIPWKKVISSNSEDSSTSSDSEFTCIVPEVEFSNSGKEHNYAPERKRRVLSDDVNSVKSKTSRESFSKVKIMFHEPGKPTNPECLVIPQREIPVISPISKSTITSLNKSIVPTPAVPTISQDNGPRVPTTSDLRLLDDNLTTLHNRNSIKHCLEHKLETARTVAADELIHNNANSDVNNSMRGNEQLTFSNNRKPSNLNCPICPQKYINFRNYKNHIWKHGKERSFKCKVCDQKFETSGASCAHQLAHNNTDPEIISSSNEQRTLYKCRACSLITDSVLQLETHICFNMIKEYKCPNCPKVFPYKKILDEHTRCHIPEAERESFLCSFCDKSFLNKVTMKRHEKIVHKGVQSFRCKPCRKTWLNKENFQHHQCQKQKRYPMKKVECHICNRLMVNSQALKGHLRTHTGEKRFMCETCGRKFLSKLGLNNHAASHSDERPHLCHFCAKSFKTDIAFKRHVASVHKKNAKIFHCDTCDKDFTPRDNYVRHLRTHTGEKPYECKICGHRSIQSSTLKSHIKVHHKGANVVNSIVSHFASITST